MRHDFVGSIARVDGGLENLHALARDFRAAETADQFFALAGEHWADDDFDPAHIAFDDVHDCSLEKQLSVFSSKYSVREINLGSESPVFTFLPKRTRQDCVQPLGTTTRTDYACELAAAGLYILAL